MKILYYVSVAAAALCLLLSIVVLSKKNSTAKLQAEIQKQQQELQRQQEQINTGNQISQKVGPELLRDMAISSVKNDKMKALLGKHGYNVATPAPATPEPSKPTPKATPASSAPAPGIQ